MKRSQSSSIQKNKRPIKIETFQSNQKHIKVQPVKSIKTNENTSISERPKSARLTFEDRLKKIKQGFQDLQKNLNFNKASEIQQMIVPTTSTMTTRKIVKKLDFEKKTTGKKEASHKKSMTKLTSEKTINKYHSCAYEKSLYNLMKIVVFQKDQITRLNNQINTYRSIK